MKLIKGVLHLEESDSTRCNIVMNEKFMVAVILTSEGFIFDIYDNNGDELIDTTSIAFSDKSNFFDEDDNSHRYQSGYCNNCAGSCQYDGNGNFTGDTAEFDEEEARYG